MSCYRRAVVHNGGAPLGIILDNAGVRVARVPPGTAAARANIQAGDLLLKCNGLALPGPDRVALLRALVAASQQVTLDLWRPSTRP
ncbi:MAG: PDZ domain-containing protein [Limisphaerales bacterium]